MGQRKRFDTSLLCTIIEERLSVDELARQMRVGEGRLSRLLDGTAEFKQSEMLCAARLLGLNRYEFERCFFTVDVQKI